MYIIFLFVFGSFCLFVLVFAQCSIKYESLLNKKIWIRQETYSYN